jgi:hypothetical protein
MNLVVTLSSCTLPANDTVDSVQGDGDMAFLDDQLEGCRHERAPLTRLGKIRHERTGRCVYVLLCTECGFTVTTDQLRRLRQEGARQGCVRQAPRWAPQGSYRPLR